MEPSLLPLVLFGVIIGVGITLFWALLGCDTRDDFEYLLRGMFFIKRRRRQIRYVVSAAERRRQLEALGPVIPRPQPAPVFAVMGDGGGPSLPGVDEPPGRQVSDEPSEDPRLVIDLTAQ